jgi:hypothetical protein
MNSRLSIIGNNYKVYREYKYRNNINKRLLIIINNIINKR